MLLTYRDGVFLFGSAANAAEAERLAHAAGLTLSTSASAARGFPVFFTSQAYAVLHLWDVADAAAKEKLAPLREQWEQSNLDRIPSSVSLDIPVPAGRSPLPYQRAGVWYAQGRENVLFGDAPGLGKTAESIMLANLRGCKRVLVVCPANIRLNWRREIRAWSTIPDVVVYPVLKASDGVHPFAHYVIVSYEIARDSLFEVLRDDRWDMLVIDEGHYLKTPDSGRTRALFGGGAGKYKDGGIADVAEQKVVLTGTPLPNRPRECYTLAKALDHSAIDWMSEASFRERFNPGGVDPRGFHYEYSGRLPELNARMRCNFMVRRLKEDVLKDLPPKRYELAYQEQTGAVAMALQAERMLDIDPDDMVNNGFVFDGEISTVRRMMGEAMAPGAVEHCRMILEGGTDKLVVFAHHKAVLTTIEEGLAKFGVLRVDGSTSPRNRQAYVEVFKHDPRKRVMLGQLQAIGTGTDGLQEVCDHCVFAEASWVPGENEQAVDRLHRIGQPGSVLAQFLVAQGSLAERILGRAIEKAQITNEVLDAKPVSGRQ